MKHTIFGESHGPAIGVVLEQVPAGIVLDEQEVAREMARRAPGKSPLSTARKEADIPRILSGVFQGKTTGAPLCAIIENTNQHSRDYEKTKNLARPGHADYTGYVRYQGCNDYRGGGHFSGRLTAPLVFAGAVAKQILSGRGITVGAHIRQIANVEDTPFTNDELPLTPELFRQVSEKAFPVLDDERGAEMQAEILAAKNALDSVGGVIECAVLGVPAGVGSPDFGYNVEGVFAQHMFAVPAVKGIAFGAGFGFAGMKGSEANDPFCVEAGQVRTRTNYNGGVNGGISNGMPILFEVVIRPTPSIAREQDTVDLATMEKAKLCIEGRHDPCIVHRAVPVIEAAAALAICELLGI
ncbi:MAG: chorismate synthase [Candidatus Onthomonas sp.]|nr:chorismate synthase [Candidatus Onthomonas sp.]